MKQNFLKIVTVFLFLGIIIIGGYFIVENNKKEIPNEVVNEGTKVKRIINREVIDNNNLGGREVFSSEVLLPDDCIDISSDEKDNCLNKAYYNISYINEDLSDCLRINNYDKRNDCIYGQVKTFQSLRNCQRIADSKRADSCVEDLSIYTNYSGFCELFDEESNEKRECLDRMSSFLIPKKGDINKCSSIQSLEYKNLCFQHFYGKCDELKDRGDRDNCNSANKYFLIDSIDDCKSLKSSIYKKVCLEKFKDINKGKKSFEIDTDSDGLWDEKELWINTDPFNPDTDGDGLTDYQEIMEEHSNPIEADTDQDGLSDYEEVQLGTDLQKVDSDGDGVWDSADKDVLNNDTDDDGLSDDEELLWGTDPNKKDTDGDGASDYEEVKNGKNALGEGWKQDTDGDGLIDVDEIFYLTDPLRKDTDGDGINDKDEIEAGTNPNGGGDFDFDGDRLSDKKELELGTNPYKSDTNNDGVTDYESIKKGLDPISKDTDGDGLNNIYELKNKLNPIKSDTDADGLSDGDEINKYFTNPRNQDTDNDGFLDGEEVQAGFDPRSASGV